MEKMTSSLRYGVSSNSKFYMTVAAFIAIFIVISIPCILSEDSSAAICDNIRIYVENESGEYDMTYVDGVSTVKQAVEAGLDKLGIDYSYNNEGKFNSVGGRTLDDEHYWRIHQWLPLGTSGWGLMNYTAESDDKMKSGTTYCLHIATMSDDQGSIVYSVPNFKPISTGYVFIRFANGFDENNTVVMNTFTAEIRKEGFWLKGTGSSMGEVLKNAVQEQGFAINLKTGVDGNGNDLQCWIISMFGLGDVSTDNGTTWSYWSQWTWVNSNWDYNKWTLGYYDPAVYKYAECVYLISTPDPYGDGDFIIDKGGPEPNPDIDEIVLIKNYNSVVFKVNGEIVSKQIVRYGRQADLSRLSIPEAPEGKVFLGWGDVTIPITEDTVFEAQFGDANQYTVKYYDESGTVLLHTELVYSGQAAKYSNTPSKPETDEYTYTFKGWSKDLSNITSDISVTPVYEAVPKGVHVHTWEEDATTNPTCTEPGSKTYRCSCGETKTEKLSALGHNWSEWKVIKEATYQEDGSESRTCARCGESETKVISKLTHTTHTWGDGIVTTQPTCTESGVRTYTCVCGETKTESISATGHSWSAWVVGKEATYNEDGYQSHTCSKCNITETQTIPKLSHSTHTWGDGVVTTEPTCTGQGVRTYTCVCGEIKTELIPATGHTWSVWIVGKEATYSEDGYQTHTCSTCGTTETQTIPKLSHTVHEWGDGVVTTEPTCTESGIRTYTCICGETKTESIPATGHTWNSGTVTLEPTCTEPGSKTYTCASCGETKTESILATGHSWSDWVVEKEATYKEDGYQTRTCLKCEYIETKIIPKLTHDIHSWDVGEVVKEATCSDSGLRIHHCTVCGETLEEIIPALGHDWSDWTVERAATEESNGLKTRTCSNCGGTETMETLFVGKEPTIQEGESSTTTAEDDGNGAKAESKLESESENDGNTVITKITEKAIEEAINQLKKLDITDVTVTITIQVETKSSGSAVINLSSQDISQLSESGEYTMKYSSGLLSMDIDSSVLASVGGNDASIKVDKNVLADNRFSNISGGQSINLSLISGGSAVHNLGGNVGVSVPYIVPEGYNSDNLRVWYVDNGELKEVTSNYDAESGTVNFLTDHFSEWIVGFEETPVDQNTSDDGMSLILILAVCIVAISISVGIIIHLRRR